MQVSDRFTAAVWLKVNSCKLALSSIRQILFFNWKSLEQRIFCRTDKSVTLLGVLSISRSSLEVKSELGEDGKHSKPVQVSRHLHSLSSFGQSRILAVSSTLSFNVTRDHDWSESLWCHRKRPVIICWRLL